MVFIHSIAISGSNIYGYNNRALVSISYIIPIFIILIEQIITPKKFKIILIIYITIIFTSYILILDKHIDYVKNRNNSVEKIISNFEYKNQKKSYLIYIDDYKDDDKFYNYFTYVNDNFDFRYQLPSISKNTLMGTSVNIHEYCNRLYWDSHFNSYIIKWFNKNNNIFIVEDINQKLKFYKYENLDDVWQYLSKRFQCSTDNNIAENLNKSLGKKNNKNFVNNSYFLKIVIKIYNNYFSKYFSVKFDS